MRPTRSTGPVPSERHPWAPPTVTKLDIATVTKSSAAVRTVDKHQVEATVAEPRPPAAPAMKFGFSFEWSFPLSARTEG